MPSESKIKKIEVTFRQVVGMDRPWTWTHIFHHTWSPWEMKHSTWHEREFGAPKEFSYERKWKEKRCLVCGDIRQVEITF
jgi:hypothetical protein